MTKEKIFLTILLAVVCLFSAITVNKKLTENDDMAKYKQAIELYQKNEFDKAYNYFSQISRFSVLKPAALFREARCAQSSGNIQAAMRNYSILLKRFPNSSLYPISEYNLAVLLFDRKDYFAAKRHFNHLINKFGDTEVAIASKYYLGIINNDSQLLIEYLRLSPNGRHAQNAIDILSQQDIKFTNEENLVIANSYLATDNYANALNYYQKTSLPYSWCGYARTLYKLGKWNEAKSITVKGLQLYSSFAEPKCIYENIDSFISLSDSKLTTLKYLYSINPKAKGADYILYLTAKYSPSSETPYIYEQLYKKFPDGQFSGEALYKTFYSKINQDKYDTALKLGRIHLSRFSNTNSAPAVMYWMAKIYDKKQMYDMAKSYYKGVLSKYPDSYYALRANAKLHQGHKMLEDRELCTKPVVFPTKNKSEADLAIKLAQLGDYDFVKELYKNDEFVQSWIEYQQGNYTHSAFIAREAMDKLEIKPDFKGIFVSGLMFTENSLYTLEFNMRPGLPEFDVLTIHLQNNIFDLFYKIEQSNFSRNDLIYKKGITGCVNAVYKDYELYTDNPQNKIISLDRNDLLLYKDNLYINTFINEFSENNKAIINPHNPVLSIIKNDINNPFEDIYQYLTKLGNKDLYYRKDIGKIS